MSDLEEGRQAAVSDKAKLTEGQVMIWCPDCLTQFFFLVRVQGEIRFQCANCSSDFIDDEGFGRP